MVGATVVTAVTAQRTDPVVATIGRAYTAAHTTSATTISLTGNNNKTRTSPMGTSQANLLAASAAAGLTGGTRTLDANAFGIAPITNIVGLGTGTLLQELYSWESLGMHPVVLAANEGVEVAWGATAIATGTISVNILMAFAEVIVF